MGNNEKDFLELSKKLQKLDDGEISIDEIPQEERSLIQHR